jgi:biopolymer transport protein ExbD
MLNMTPMIDVVFLLIIFFMTVSQVTKTNDLKVELPKLKGAEDLQTRALIFNIDEAGEIWVSGQKRTLTEAVLIAAKELDRVGNDPRLLKISVRNDRRAECNTLNQLFRELGQLGTKGVSINTESRR